MEIKVAYDECNDDGELEISYEDFRGDISNELVEVYHYQKQHEFQNKSVEWISLDEFTKLGKLKWKCEQVSKQSYVDFLKLIRLVSIKKYEEKSFCEIVALSRNYNYERGINKAYLNHDFSRDLFQRIRIIKGHEEISRCSLMKELVIGGREYIDDKEKTVKWEIFNVTSIENYEKPELFFGRKLDEDKFLIKDFMVYQKKTNMKVNRITDRQLRRGLKRDEEVMGVDDNIKYSKIKIEGNCPFQFNGEALEVSNVWRSPDYRFVFVEIWKNELFLVGKIKEINEIITIEYINHYENKEYGIDFCCFSVQWNEYTGELFSINAETLELKTRLLLDFREK